MCLFIKNLIPKNPNCLQVDHKQLLRPTLGHPQQEGKLENLCEREEDRKEMYLAGVERQMTALQDSAVSQAQGFLESLARTSETLLLQFDNLLTVDDVEKGSECRGFILARINVHLTLIIDFHRIDVHHS